MIELLALKLKEVSKKASNIDEKIDNLAISQEKELNDKANAILKDFEVKYENYVKNIALPKDGKDFDLNLWENFEKDRDIVINKTVSELNDLKAEIIKFFQEQTANYNAIIKENELQNNKKEANYNAFLKEKESRIDEIILNIESFKGEDGKDGKDGAKGKDGKDGAKGKDGKNGIGIKDITEKNGEIVITLTDGTIKKLKMPRDIRVISGGGGSKGGGVSYYSNLNLTPYKVGGIEAGTSFDNVEITKMFDMLLYPFEISLNITPNKAQLGDTLNSILLKFETNGASESNINGIDVTGLDELIYPEPVSENKIFTLTAKKDNQTKTKQVSIQFLNNIYWGATSNPNPTNAEILASNKELSNSKSKSVVYDCSGGKRYFIAYPKRLGSVTLSVNGFPNNNFTQIQRAFTNEFGYIEDYFICYGNTIVFGSDIPAVWS